jgi:hypothetical protein
MLTMAQNRAVIIMVIVVAVLVLITILVSMQNASQDATGLVISGLFNKPAPTLPSQAQVYWVSMPLGYFVDMSSCKGTVCFLYQQQIKKATEYYTTQFSNVKFVESANRASAQIVFVVQNNALPRGFVALGETHCQIDATVSGKTFLKQCVISLNRLDGCAIPVITIHEIAHTLGLQHVNDRNNLMYPMNVDCFAAFNDGQLSYLHGLNQQ